MKRESLDAIVAIAVALGLVFGGVMAITVISGVQPPFTVVESQSMQHSNSSEIGIIDTGDMVLLKNPNNTSIVSYVEGYHSGYSSFGEYGSVIIYERGGSQNPVIHRAILWLTYNSDGTWSAPALQYYENADGTALWSCTSGTSWDQLSGTLYLYEVGYSDKTAYVNLDYLAEHYPHSGYLTMGDNAINTNFDQTLGIYSGLVAIGSIHAVAWIEIPWLGALKLYLNNNTSSLNLWAANSLPDLGLALLAVIVILIVLNFIADEAYIMYVRHKRREMNIF